MLGFSFVGNWLHKSFGCLIFNGTFLSESENLCINFWQKQKCYAKSLFGRSERYNNDKVVAARLVLSQHWRKQLKNLLRDTWDKKCISLSQRFSLLAFQKH